MGTQVEKREIFYKERAKGERKRTQNPAQWSVLLFLILFVPFKIRGRKDQVTIFRQIAVNL